MIYFYANDEYMGKCKMTAYGARKVVRNMNIVSIRQWEYSYVKR